LRADLERLRRDWLTGRTTYVQVRDVTPPPAKPVEAHLAAEGGRSPKLAFFLGFIPGVGALYNAQYKKAAIQMLIFATLSALGRAMDSARFSSLESFFSFLMFGFYAYMVFDSYHTAKSRLRQS
jgi:hypothetical protein